MTRTEKALEARRRIDTGIVVHTPTTTHSQSRALPCELRGPVISGESASCSSCRGNVSLKVFGCQVHGKCTITKATSGVAGCCATCPQYRATKAPIHPNIPAARHFAENIPPYPQGSYSGRGIVICGGGKYWTSTYVTVRMIRHVGCTLPIQVWYLGEKERDDRFTALLSDYDVEVVDAVAHPLASLTRSKNCGFPGHPPFEVKSFAVLHSRFEEVLSLDADSYPCTDPTVLFSCPKYRRTGGVFWPDLPNTLRWTKWKDWGVEPHGPKCGWEVGQYLLSKRTAWRQLNLARWYDDHGDWCYGAGAHHDHGDKGPHRVAWGYFHTEPTFYSLKTLWRHFAFLQCGPNGHTPMFVHRCRSKFSLSTTNFVSTPQHGDNIRGGLPEEQAAFEYLEELRASL